MEIIRRASAVSAQQKRCHTDGRKFNLAGKSFKLPANSPDIGLAGIFTDLARPVQCHGNRFDRDLTIESRAIFAFSLPYSQFEEIEP
jgi:hypothetical protein